VGEAGDITVLLRKWKAGDEQACDQLMSHVYPHLHNVAAAYLRRESDDHTLQPTALVHELYIRLLQQRKPDWDDSAHFYAFAAKVMRRILTDHARSSHAGKRGSGLPHLPLSDEIPWIDLNSEDVLDLNRALDELESVDPRKVRLVELRYFLGCTTPESAALLSISTATAERDLTMART
jgi:RNA polymerase sigma factor (TIGR02999 family)